MGRKILQLQHPSNTRSCWAGVQSWRGHGLRVVHNVHSRENYKCAREVSNRHQRTLTPINRKLY